MPKMIPLHTVMIGREGKTIIPEIGKAFNFTKEEIEEITSVNATALREPVNETEEGQAKVVQETKPGKAGAGKPKVEEEI